MKWAQLNWKTMASPDLVNLGNQLSITIKCTEKLKTTNIDLQLQQMERLKFSRAPSGIQVPATIISCQEEELTKVKKKALSSAQSPLF